LEHVQNQEKFLDECERVAKTVSVHWFPFGPFAELAEQTKKKYGHYHPCRIPEEKMIRTSGYDTEEFMTWGEHMLLCMTLTPTLKAKEVYDLTLEHYDYPYGIILKEEK
jgi:hypothetical protein